MSSYPIVNSRDEVLFYVGSERTAELLISTSPDKYIRRVHVFIECFGGYFIVQQPLGASKLTSTVTGYVKGSETYKDAAIRLLNENLGLMANQNDVEEVTKFFSKSHQVNGFITLFTYLFDPQEEGIKLNERKVEAAVIIKLNDLINDIDNDTEKYDSVFIDLLNIYLQMS